MDKDNTRFQNFVFEYARFHSDAINKVIHILFVPMIWFTAELLLLEYLPVYKVPNYIPFFSEVLMNPLNEISMTVAVGGSLLILYFFIDLGTACVTTWWTVPSYMLAI